MDKRRISRIVPDTFFLFRRRVGSFRFVNTGSRIRTRHVVTRDGGGGSTFVTQRDTPILLFALSILERIDPDSQTWKFIIPTETPMYPAIVTFIKSFIEESYRPGVDDVPPGVI